MYTVQKTPAMRPGPGGPTYADWEAEVIEAVGQAATLSAEQARNVVDMATAVLLDAWHQGFAPRKTARLILTSSRHRRALTVPR